MPLQRIVIGVDFSPASTEAARWAAQHFQDGVELIFAHAVSGRAEEEGLSQDSPDKNAAERLRIFAESISAKRMRLDTRRGNAARLLSDIATETDADLLIVGARGERAAIDRSLGTTAQYVVRESTVPVLVVAQARDRGVSRILVPVDDESAASESLRWAALLSNRFNADVTTFHVDASGALSQPALPRRDAEPSVNADSNKARRWKELAQASGIPGDRVTSEVASGVPAVEIVSAATRNAADIIVMGRKTARSLQRAVLGSVTATVLSSPPCSVLVVPANGP